MENLAVFETESRDNISMDAEMITRSQVEIFVGLRRDFRVFELLQVQLPVEKYSYWRTNT